MDLSFAAYESCELCPRRCGVNRASGAKGVCGMSVQLTVARAALHFWEEPPISGEDGSGAVFFTGCPMKCVFCQNLSISRGRFGAPVSTERLSAIMLELQDQGALNINLVTPMHFAPHVVEAVARAREAGLTLPIVSNSSGYEREELVRA
ncbi:MAG: 4Fe-4S cluster-binding domain-containing protein, partial [Atopobiaceae bacterium]|nr:4Fe-4S cluster-binding domain-containing protein [Atopobiaceae bacterium]